MTKEQYIEHCRALFENPLMELVNYITVSNQNFVELWTNKPDNDGMYYGLADGDTMESAECIIYDIDDYEYVGKTLLSRCDFEIDGKHYK